MAYSMIDFANRTISDFFLFLETIFFFRPYRSTFGYLLNDVLTVYICYIDEQYVLV